MALELGRTGVSMRYAEERRKINTVLVLTSRLPYSKLRIGFRGSGVLGQIAFAGCLLVTDPRSSRKRNRRNFASTCQPTFPVNNRAAACLPAMGWSTEVIPGETGALETEFSGQRRSNRSAAAGVSSHLLLPLRPGHIPIEQKCLSQIWAGLEMGEGSGVFKDVS